MSQQVQETKFDAALATFSPADAAIEKMRADYMPLRSNGVGDKKALALVHDARMTVRAHRVAIEKKRVELKSDALEFGRKVDGEAKRLTALIAPIEDHLTDQEEAVLAIERAEKARKEAEIVAARKAKLDERMRLAIAVGWQIAPSSAEVMADGEFNATLEAMRATHKAAQEAEAAKRVELERLQEAARQEALREQARRDVETQKLAADRAEIDRVAAEQRRVQAQLDADRRAVEEQQREAQRAAELAEAKKKAAADALAKQKAADEAKAKREAAKLARMPQVHRIHIIANQVREVLVPEINSRGEILTIIDNAAAAIDRIAELLEAQ